MDQACPVPTEHFEVDLLKSLVPLPMIDADVSVEGEVPSLATNLAALLAGSKSASDSDEPSVVDSDWRKHFKQTTEKVNSKNTGGICNCCLAANNVPGRGFSVIWATKTAETHLRKCAAQPAAVRQTFTLIRKERARLKGVDQLADEAALLTTSRAVKDSTGCGTISESIKRPRPVQLVYQPVSLRDTPLSADEQLEFGALLIRATASGNLPPMWIENPAVRALFTFLRPAVKLPTTESNH